MSRPDQQSDDQDRDAGERSGGPPEAEELDLREKGGTRDGERQTSDRRLFVQFHAFGGCTHLEPLAEALESSGLDAVLYKDVNDPRGVGVLVMSEDPELFAGEARELLLAPPFGALEHKPDFTMLGRTYAIGYEPDLDEALVERPRNNALDPDSRWAVWYPLRRSGEFARLSDEDQRRILGEHGRIGVAFGRADLAHDVRLACFGLDRDDNDFVIGLVGRDLHPLSYVVQRMRSTEQTSRYVEKLGPFFVGRTHWQAPRD